MATPFTVDGKLNLPPTPSLPADPIPFTASGTFNDKSNQDLNLTGAGTHTVGLGTVGSPGAKLILVQVISGSITLRKNGAGAAGEEEISAGGCYLHYNPNPVAGITQLDIVYTTAAVVRFWALK